MNQSARQVLCSAMAAIFLLGACVPAQPTAEPTQDTQAIENQVATSVVLTVAAQNTQTAAAIPPATNTPLPTQTEAVVSSPTAILSTATSLVLPTVASGGGGTTTKPEYACAVVRRVPADNTVFLPNKTFDIKWTILNTGTKTMQAGLDVKYQDGTLLATTSRAELPELKPGAQYTVDFDGVAPKKEGFHVMTFVVEGGLCYPYVVIKVEK
jgi:hypothetical protein